MTKVNRFESSKGDVFVEKAGVKYKVEVAERSDINSKLEKPVKVPPLPGERTF